MLHIIWMILKIVFLVIVCALGILIILLCAALFWPVRYRIQAKKAEDIRADIRVSWLLHAVSLKAGYKDAPYLILRILGIPVYNLQKKKDKPEKEKAKKEKAKKEKPKKEKIKKEEIEKAEIEIEKEKIEKVEIEKAEKIEKSEKPALEKSSLEETIADPQELGPVQKFIAKITAFFAAIRRFFASLWQKLKNIQYTIQGFCDRIKGMAEQAAYYKEIIESEQAKRAFMQVKKQLFGILKHIRPRKLSVRLRAGFADPYTTGQVLAAYSVCYPWIWEYVMLTPDFEQEILEGELDCRGRLMLIRFLITAWKLYFDKNIKYLIKLFKTGGSKK